MEWHESPDPNMGIALYRQLAIVRGELLRLKRQLVVTEDGLKDEYKRNPAARRVAMSDLLDKQTALEVEEVRLDQEIRFYNLRCEMFRAMSFRRG